jgi:hypothetical protein
MKTITNKKMINKAYIAFAIFSQSHELNNFITDLKSIELEIKKTNTNKNLWFRFFKGDTSATTIQNLIDTYLFDNSKNQTFISDCINIALQNVSLNCISHE